MKFSHLADVHIGSWRDPKLKDLSLESFNEAMDESFKEKVDFILISGDLFNTALPSIDQVKFVVRKLKEAKEKGIEVYFIAGSHDFSPSGKTMLDVIEEAGLGMNVMKGEVDDKGKLKLEFTEDKKTKAKITGIIGRKGMLDRKDYEVLDKKSLEKEKGFKIFLFHTSLDELKPSYLKEMDSSPLSFLPKGFDYYAGGHVHIVENKNFEKEGYVNVIYPGPTFPANYSEMEKLGNGGFFIYDDGKVKRKEIVLRESISIIINVDGKTVDAAKKILSEKINSLEPKNKIVLVRIQGKLSSGKPSDIDLNREINSLYDRGAYFVMRNTSRLISQEFTEMEGEDALPEDIEEKIITANLNQIANEFSDEKAITKNLIKIFSEEKNEAEKNADYDTRLRKNADEVLK